MPSSPPPTTVAPQQETPSVFQRIEELGQRSWLSAWILAWSVALSLHAGGAGAAAAQLVELRDFARSVQAMAVARLNATIDIEPELEEPVEEEPEPEPEPTEPEPESEPIPPQEPVETNEPVQDDSPQAPPPAPAEAGQVLTANPDPSEPLDLTDQGFITGSGTRYAGGVSSAKGTSKIAVRNRSAKSGGTASGTGSEPARRQAPAEDKSRPAGLPSSRSTANCPFPAEAEAEQINNVVVTLVVVVGTDGSPRSVSVLSDPGYGFGRAAKRCAMGWREYQVGLDAWGKPITRATPPVNVRFTRR